VDFLSRSEPPTQKLAAEILSLLNAQNLKLYTIESCTGGLIAYSITTVPGASRVFWGGRVVYDNTLKQHLGVPEALLKQWGAVSEPVARSLAEQGLKKDLLPQTSSRGVCLSTTGIAGPGGGTPEKPVGLCHIGLAFSEAPTQTFAYRHPQPTDRISTQEAFALRALELLKTALLDQTHLKPEASPT
jgi:PncC family amidohydrolase